MHSIVVYFSKFGHTQQLAEAIGQTLQTAGDIRVLSADRLDPADLPSLDLLVMGTPTHNMNLPKVVQPILDGLPRRCLQGVPVAAFDTSYKMNGLLNRFTAAKRLDRRLKKLGGKRLLSPETFLVQEREGPLYDGELERATEWARTVLARQQAVEPA